MLHGAAVVAARYGARRLLHPLLEQRPFPLVGHGLRAGVRRHLARDFPQAPHVVAVNQLMKRIFGLGGGVHGVSCDWLAALILAQSGSWISSRRSASRSPRDAAMRSAKSGARRLVSQPTRNRFAPMSAPWKKACLNVSHSASTMPARPIAASTEPACAASVG